ncbi:hypothetical protein ABIB18_000092 [Pantoea sp. UYEF8]
MARYAEWRAKPVFALMPASPLLNGKAGGDHPRLYSPGPRYPTWARRATSDLLTLSSRTGTELLMAVTADAQILAERLL